MAAIRVTVTVQCVIFGLVLYSASLISGHELAISNVDSRYLNEETSLSSNVLIFFYKEENFAYKETETVLNNLLTAQKNGAFSSDVKIVKSDDKKLVEAYGINDLPRLVYFRHGDPLLYTAQPLDVEELGMWLEENRSGKSQVLTDDTFEHLTQASTGATTGDWFVMFYSKECSKYFATWNSVHSRLHRKMNVAHVDTDSSPGLKKRFDIEKCPSVIFFRLGSSYEYHLKDMDFLSLVSFAEGWYKNVKSKKVLPEPTPFDNLVENIVIKLKEFTDKPSGNVALIAATLIAFLSMSLCLIYCGGSKRTKTD